MFLDPFEGYRSKIGPIIFEFSTFHGHEFEHGRDFMNALDGFLSNLPRGWEYAVEIRNHNWLQPDYFAMLRSHGVAHVYTSWTRMPSLAEQLAIEESDTAEFMVSRLLLKPGRTYEQAVKAFYPYRLIQEENPDVRSSVKTMFERLMTKRRRGWIYINNRLEGSAPMTIDAILPGDLKKIPVL